MAANGITAAYSLVQGVRCVVGMVRGSVLFSKPLALAIFSGDQVLVFPIIEAIACLGLVSFIVYIHVCMFQLQNYPHIQNWLKGSFNQIRKFFFFFLLFSCWLCKEKDYELYA